MQQNPVAYGISISEREADPQLAHKCLALVEEAANILDRCQMIRSTAGNLHVTDLGRIASHFYIKHGTIEAFNSMITNHMSNSEALHVLCSSAEFDQVL